MSTEGFFIFKKERLLQNTVDNDISAHISQVNLLQEFVDCTRNKCLLCASTDENEMKMILIFIKICVN